MSSDSSIWCMLCEFEVLHMIVRFAKLLRQICKNKLFFQFIGIFLFCYNFIKVRQA